MNNKQQVRDPAIKCTNLKIILSHYIYFLKILLHFILTRVMLVIQGARVKSEVTKIEYCILAVNKSGLF